MDNQRKATDVLLDLESKINILLGIIQSQDLNIKLLNNKLNDVINKLDKHTPQKITVEAVQQSPVQSVLTNIAPVFKQVPAGDPDKNIQISSESSLPQESSPQGFRRNSRPETYAKTNPDASKLPQSSATQNPVATPPPGRSMNEAALQQFKSEMPTQQANPIASQGQVPVMQRVVDKNGKSIFLADVEILDLTTNKQFFKTRTNGTGKWMASLPIGTYKVIVRKRESVSKEKIEAFQNITIDGNQSPLDLPMLIIK